MGKSLLDTLLFVVDFPLVSCVFFCALWKNQQYVNLDETRKTD